MSRCTYKNRFPDMKGDMPGCRETVVCPFNDPEESCAYFVEDTNGNNWEDDRGNPKVHTERN